MTLRESDFSFSTPSMPAQHVSEFNSTTTTELTTLFQIAYTNGHEDLMGYNDLPNSYTTAFSSGLAANADQHAFVVYSDYKPVAMATITKHPTLPLSGSTMSWWILISEDRV